MAPEAAVSIFLLEIEANCCCQNEKPASIRSFGCALRGKKGELFKGRSAGSRLDVRNESKDVRRSACVLGLSPAARRCLGHPLQSALQQIARQPERKVVRLKKRLSDDARRSGVASATRTSACSGPESARRSSTTCRAMQLSPRR